MSVSLDNLEPIDVRPIKRALISVYDKTGLEDLARALGEAGVEIVSTGSTAARIAAAGVAVTPVDAVTGFPEVLEGRVKTLHPFIHSRLSTWSYATCTPSRTRSLPARPSTSASSRLTSVAPPWCAPPRRTIRRSRS